MWAPRKHTPKKQGQAPCLCAHLPPAQVLLCPALAGPRPKRRGRLVGNSDSAHPGLPRLQAQQSVGAPVPTQGLSALATLPAPHAVLHPGSHTPASAHDPGTGPGHCPLQGHLTCSPLGPSSYPAGPALPRPPPGGQQTLASITTSGRKWMACPCLRCSVTYPLDCRNWDPLPSIHPWTLDVDVPTHSSPGGVLIRWEGL